MVARQFIKLYNIFKFFYRYKLLKSKIAENEDDSTSSDSYTEKIPSSLLMEKFNKILGIIKELKDNCK